MSLNMPLSRVICATHYTCFPFGSASFTELLCWYGTVLSALPQFTCRNSVALCRPWLCVKRFVPLLVANFYFPVYTPLLCSVVHSQLLLLLSGIHFPRRFGCCQRATRLCSTNCLKLIFFTVVGLEAPLSSFLEGALPITYNLLFIQIRPTLEISGKLLTIFFTVATQTPSQTPFHMHPLLTPLHPSSPTKSHPSVSRYRLSYQHLRNMTPLP